MTSDRVMAMPFLFRREIANRLRRGDKVLAANIAAAFRGDGDSQNYITDLLIKMYHPDKQQRRAAAQRMFDYFEFSCVSDIKKAESAGDVDLARKMRQELDKTLASLEDEGQLLHRITIDADDVNNA